jgi:uncharacterized protein YndB with AHSA1/START domain
MSARSTHHMTFVIERTYKQPPARVFAAWSQAEAKARWFAGPADKWTQLHREFDFRVGGRERLSGKFANGRVSAFDCLYWDIVKDQRIIYSYDMHVDQKRISVSQATVEFMPAADGTLLIFTEQAVHLDGYPTPEDREAGTRGLLENLGAALDKG